jgi:CheY-like chemotaxis protein
MSEPIDEGSACPYCGRHMKWVPTRWFGRGCFECEQCGEFPDLRAGIGAAPVAHRDGRRIPPRRDDRPRVLLVDDSVEHRDLYALMLEPTASVITASRGDEALALARKERFDVIVLDVMMPGMNGWDVCLRLKEDPATADIPVLMLTSLDGVETAEPGHRAGAAAVLMKPCPAERLAIAIDDAIRWHASNALTDRGVESG